MTLSNDEYVQSTDTGTMSDLVSRASQWGNSSYEASLAGFTAVDACAIDSAAFSAGSNSKYIASAGTLENASATRQVLTLSGASSFSSGTGTTTFENIEIDLTGGSHLDCPAGGTLVLKNCTIKMDAASYITSAGTLNITDCAITGTTDRTSAAIRVTGGTTTLSETTSGATTISGITNTDGANSPGAVFNVSGEATLHLAGGTISGCSIDTDEEILGGGAVAYVSDGTINLSGATVKNCGSGGDLHWTGSPFVVAVSGTMNMTGGAITDCKGTHGGAVCLTSGSSAVNVSGGTISGCTAGNDGGAIYAPGTGAAVAVSGGSITGCSADRSGGAISARWGAVVNVTGGSITGNQVTGASGEAGNMAAIAGFDGSVGTFTISGSPVISGNTNAAGAEADVMAYSSTSLKIGDLGADASVGVTSATASLLVSGAQFADASSGAASSTTNLDMLFNDSDASLHGIPGTGGAITWGTYVCQIRDDATGTVLARYVSLADPCAAVDDNQTIVMLQDVTQTAAITLPAKTFSITIVDSAARKTINRGYTGASLFTTASGTNLTITGIIVDGQKASHYSTTQGGILDVVAGSTFVMDSGCTIQNSKVDLNVWPGGGAILLSGTMEMHDGSLGQGCITTAVWGGFLFQDSGSTFTADGGALNDNAVTDRDSMSGGAIIQNPDGTNITTTLGGTFSATGNRCTGHGSVIHGGGSGSVINI